LDMDSTKLQHEVHNFFNRYQIFFPQIFLRKSKISLFCAYSSTKKKGGLGPNHIGQDRDLGSGLCPYHPRLLQIKYRKGLARPTISVLVFAYLAVYN